MKVILTENQYNFIKENLILESQGDNIIHALLEKLNWCFFILKVKGITKVFEEWKSAEACILNVFCCADCD